MRRPVNSEIFSFGTVVLVSLIIHNRAKNCHRNIFNQVRLSFYFNYFLPMLRFCPYTIEHIF